MSTNKNQHYVPRLLLKRWAAEGAECIRTVHLKSERIIVAAPIKNQCSKDWMYGNDLLVENLFTGMEGNAQTAIEYFSSSEDPPLAECQMKAAILIFMLTQEVRTEASIEGLQTTFLEMLSEACDRKIPSDLSYLLAEMDSSKRAKLVLSASASNLPFLFDLSFRVLDAEEGSKFVISDNPCLLTNQLFQHESDISSIGWGMVGIQAFLPISPRSVIMLYDRKVYKVGNRRDGFRLNIGRADVSKLNLLQTLNALHSIYVSPDFDEIEIRRLLRDSKEKRKHKRDIIRRFTDDGKSTLITSSRASLNMAIDWRFCKVLKKHRGLRSPENWGPRDRRLAEIHHNLVVLRKQNPAKVAELFDYMMAYQLERWRCY